MIEARLYHIHTQEEQFEGALEVVKMDPHWKDKSENAQQKVALERSAIEDYLGGDRSGDQTPDESHRIDFYDMYEYEFENTETGVKSYQSYPLRPGSAVENQDDIDRVVQAEIVRLETVALEEL